MQEVPPASRKPLLIKLAVAGVVVLAAGVLIWQGVDVKGLIVRGMALIAGAGPWVFFGAMAVLPAFGAPQLAFALPAGPAFIPVWGRGGVLLAYGAAIAVNLALTYWLARYAVRPLVARLMTRLGYRLPPVPRDEQVELTVLVRVTPGTPFCFQSYLLGLGEVPFPTYLAISWPVAMAYGTGFVLAGDALMRGEAGMAIFGVSVLVVAVIAVHLLRKHYAKGRAQSVR